MITRTMLIAKNRTMLKNNYKCPKSDLKCCCNLEVLQGRLVPRIRYHKRKLFRSFSLNRKGCYAGQIREPRGRKINRRDPLTKGSTAIFQTESDISTALAVLWYQHRFYRTDSNALAARLSRRKRSRKARSCACSVGLYTKVCEPDTACFIPKHTVQGQHDRNRFPTWHPI